MVVDWRATRPALPPLLPCLERFFGVDVAPRLLLVLFSQGEDLRRLVALFGGEGVLDVATMAVVAAVGAGAEGLAGELIICDLL